MTLPTLIQKNEERATVAKVKKFYSIINQALLLAINEHGTVDEWNFTDDIDEEDNKYLSNKLAKYFKPYLKISKYCGDKEGCLGYTESIKLLSGTDHNNYEIAKSYAKMILQDGTTMWLRRDYDSSTNNITCNQGDNGLKNICGVIWVDINGKKQPNTVGKDIFSFYIQKNRIIPHTILDDCKIDLAGWSCSNYILQNDNMDYLKK